MEIVRQRRKRLLAWVLTLVLCVGMWQGNVMAEGEDGGDGALTSPEVMSTEVPPAEVLEVGILNTDKEVVNGWGLRLGDDEFKPNEKGYFEFSNETELSQPYLACGNKSHLHNFLGWYDNTFNLTNSIPESGTVYAMFGKNIEISFWDGINSSGNVEGTTIDVKNIYKGQENITEKNYTFVLPNAGNENGYVTEWGIVAFKEDGTFTRNVIGKPRDEHSVNYESGFESNQKIFACSYSTKISNAGNYVLCPGTKYTLDSKGWRVNNGEDGYTYGNDNGINFYVQDKAEYSFGK